MFNCALYNIVCIYIYTQEYFVVKKKLKEVTCLVNAVYPDPSTSIKSNTKINKVSTIYRNISVSLQLNIHFQQLLWMCVCVCVCRSKRASRWNLRFQSSSAGCRPNNTRTQNYWRRSGKVLWIKKWIQPEEQRLTRQKRGMVCKLTRVLMFPQRSFSKQRAAIEREYGQVSALGYSCPLLAILLEPFFFFYWKCFPCIDLCCMFVSRCFTTVSTVTWMQWLTNPRCCCMYCNGYRTVHFI